MYAPRVTVSAATSRFRSPCSSAPCRCGTMTALRHWPSIPSTLDDDGWPTARDARPALWHVLRAGLAAKPSKVVVVVGHGADDVRAEVARWGITPTPVFVEQAKQLGTGHAV